MIEEELKSLRMRVYELTTTNSALQQENSSLQSRISELYTWSQVYLMTDYFP